MGKPAGGVDVESISYETVRRTLKKTQTSTSRSPLSSSTVNAAEPLGRTDRWAPSAVSSRS